mmetsp:Transcript_4592/g.12878  ORF Transcript_4592/g.12878 Transcript_4592/m.12878 type:complete len:81 (+) Transcript_4592:1151-1393(+)
MVIGYKDINNVVEALQSFQDLFSGNKLSVYHAKKTWMALSRCRLSKTRYQSGVCSLILEIYNPIKLCLNEATMLCQEIWS